jgi:hypothetical protein
MEIQPGDPQFISAELQTVYILVLAAGVDYNFVYTVYHCITGKRQEQVVTLHLRAFLIYDLYGSVESIAIAQTQLSSLLFIWLWH